MLRDAAWIEFGNNAAIRGDLGFRLRRTAFTPKVQYTNAQEEERRSSTPKLTKHTMDGGIENSEARKSSLEAHVDGVSVTVGGCARQLVYGRLLPRQRDYTTPPQQVRVPRMQGIAGQQFYWLVCSIEPLKSDNA